MSEQNNSRLYNEGNDYGERDYAPAQRKKKRKRGRVGRIVRRIFQVLGTLLLIGLVTGAFLCCFAAVYIKSVIIPEAGTLDLSQFTVGENSVMYYTDPNTGMNTELVRLQRSLNSTWVDYADMPKNLINATVAIEDKRFWDHSGVDWIRTAKAVLNMMTGKDIQGGSTLTQQLIKNITQYDDVTVKRKIVEIFRALQFSKDYTKEETLEWYLNFIYLGEGCQGVGAASLKYFGKPVDQLSLAECASLISITNNPTIYGPYSTVIFTNKDTGEKKTAREYNKERQELVLSEMLKQEYISQYEYDQALAQELDFVRSEGEQGDSTVYSWYEEQVIDDVLRDLVDQYNFSKELANQLLTSGGLSIYTCLDPKIQAQVEEIYSNRENLDYTSKRGQQLQSAITVIDNSTGDLVAIAGRVGEKTGNLWMNFATDSYRQPGSSIKPLAVYAPALEMGLISPISVVDDYPHHLEGGRAWPVNVDGRYRGLVTVNQALTNSYNTVSVRVLADMVTPEKSFEFMQDRFHIPLVSARESGGRVYSDIAVSPLATGGLTDGANTRDMAEAFASFANNGVYTYSRTYSKVVDSTGKVWLDNTIKQEPIMKETTAYYINQMLRNVVSSGSGSSAALSGMTVAGKTGTTDSKFDRWFVGYTPYYTAAVWVGYEQPERVNVSGNPAIDMWKKVMKPLHADLENKKFASPGGLVTVEYCKDSGMLPGEYCKLDPRGDRVASATVFKDDAPKEYCTRHTAESTITVCLDSPILGEEGNETGLYHLAGEFCPEERLKQISYVDYDRESVGGATAGDSKYIYNRSLDIGACTVHTAAPQPDPEDPNGGGEPGGMDPSDPNYPSNPDDPDLPIDPNNPGTSTDPGDPGTTVPPEPVDPGDVIINPATGRPYGY